MKLNIEIDTTSENCGLFIKVKYENKTILWTRNLFSRTKESLEIAKRNIISLLELFFSDKLNIYIKERVEKEFIIKDD
jgi:hypothetical protein